MNISKENSTGKKLRIGISTHDFLILSGARDLLRMIIRGLKLRNEHELFLLMDKNDAEGEDYFGFNSLNDWLGRTIPKYNSWQHAMVKIRKIIWKSINRIYFFSTAQVLRRKAQNLLGQNVINGLKIIPYSGMPDGLNNIISRKNIDVVIPTLFELQTPFVSYLYDCQHKYFPENFSASDISLRNILFQKLLDGSNALIVNSKDAKNDLIKYFRVDERKIVPLPFTPQLETGVFKERPELRRKYHLTSKYFMVSNQFWIHKSLETALKALRLVIDEGLEDCHIVFTGQMEDTRFPEYVPKLLKQVKELNLTDNTTFLGYIPKRDQLEIMKNSTAVIQTTLFEGGPGGGAIYDAVSLGVRSIVSNIPINRELPLSENLVLFKPKNIRDLANKMRRFWNEDYLRPNNRDLLSVNQKKLKVFSDALYTAIYLARQNFQNL